MGDVKGMLTNLLAEILKDYGLVIGCVAIGILIGWYSKILISDRKYNKQIQLRFEEKNEHINDLKLIVHGRLMDIKVEKKDGGYFRRIKKYFKKTVEI